MPSIIAIHGLNTNPDRSFIAYETDGDQNSRHVHWLRDEDMLPALLGLGDLAKLPARIFTYSWNAQTFDQASSDSFGAQAKRLIQGIHSMRHEVCHNSHPPGS